MKSPIVSKVYPTKNGPLKGSRFHCEIGGAGGSCPQHQLPETTVFIESSVL